MTWTKDSEQQESVRDLGVYEGGIYEHNIYDRGWKWVDPEDPKSIRDVPPANTLLNDDGNPILNDDGNYILIDNAFVFTHEPIDSFRDDNTTHWTHDSITSGRD